MKRLFILLLFIIPFSSFSQSLNGYKYIYIPDSEFDKINGIESDGFSYGVREEFLKLGFIIVTPSRFNSFYESGNNPCELIRADVTWNNKKVFYYNKSVVHIKLYNCLNELIFSRSAVAGSDVGSRLGELKRASKKIIKRINYRFNSDLTPDLPNNKYDLHKIDENLDITSEASIREYFDKNDYEFIEGIWGINSQDNYKLAIFKEGYKKEKEHLNMHK